MNASPKISDSIPNGLPFLNQVVALRGRFDDDEILAANGLKSMALVIDLREQLSRRSSPLSIEDAFDVLGIDDVNTCLKLIDDGLSDEDVADEQFTSPEMVAIIRAWQDAGYP